MDEPGSWDPSTSEKTSDEWISLADRAGELNIPPARTARLHTIAVKRRDLDNIEPPPFLAPVHEIESFPLRQTEKDSPGTPEQTRWTTRRNIAESQCIAQFPEELAA
jgi:hypothetical protein